MENQQQRWVMISYTAVSALVGFILFSILLKASATWDWETRFRSVDWAIRGISIVAGLILFWILNRNEQVNQFMNEVVTELARVTWPSQKDTSSATFIVIIMVVISGLLLGLFDYLWTTLMQMIL